jgi:hypothetical protein
MKITARKQVFWNSGGKMMSGIVEQVLGDHAVIKTPSGKYIVANAVLASKPVSKIASFVMAGLDGLEDTLKVMGIEFSFDPGDDKRPPSFNMKHIDPVRNGVTVGACTGNDPLVKALDSMWKEGAMKVDEKINPELMRGNGPGLPPAGVKIKEPQQQQKTDPFAVKGTPAKPTTTTPQKKQQPGMLGMM